jgi:hypothetical protein
VASVAGEVPIRFELLGERRVGGEPENLELPVGAATLHPAAAVPVQLAGAHDAKNGRAVPQRRSLGVVLGVLVTERRVQPVGQHGAVLVGDVGVELDQEGQPWQPTDPLGERRDEQVPPPQRRECLVDGGDDLDLVELLPGERDDALALLHEPDERRVLVAPGHLDDVVHVVPVEA